MQKYLEEVNISKEKFEVIKSVNKELQNNVEKLQKEIKEKQKILESQTQGKENLNAILWSKINLNKEGIRFLLKTKKKYDVKTISFVPQQTTKTNSLIKINYLITKNSTQILKDKASQKEKKWKKINLVKL